MIRSTARCALVALGTTATYAALVAWVLPVAAAGGTATLDDLLVRGAALLAVVAGGWLWLGILVTIGGAIRRTPLRGGLPGPVRRLVLTVCGVALTGGLAVAPAAATPGRVHEDRAARPAAVAGLPLPDLPTTAAPARSVRPPHQVVVADGDTLWSIAERTLGAGATDAEVEARWQQIYADNRAAIGPDPDLVHPALRLQVPTRR